MAQKSMNEVREPQQQRSIQRTDDILQATEQIILEKGFANLTITEIAERAKVTPGSMYQYFKNKSEILLSLARRYSALIHEMFRDIYVERATTLEEHVQRFLIILDRQYTIHRENPAIRDIWMAAATDKAMKNLFDEENARNLAFHIELASPFFPEEYHPEMTRVLHVLMRMGIASTLLALEYEGEEAQKILETTKHLVISCWRDFIKQCNLSS